MKYSLLFAAALIVLWCPGCLDREDGYLHFSFFVNYDVDGMTLPGDPLLSMLPPQPLPDIPIDMNTDSEFNSQAFNHLVRIRIKELVFTILPSSTDPASDPKEPGVPTPDDWSFLESAQIWFQHPLTLEEALVAYVVEGDPHLDPGVTTLAFSCLDSNIVHYFDASHNTTLILRAVGTSPPDNVIFNIDVKFELTAALIR